MSVGLKSWILAVQCLISHAKLICFRKTQTTHLGFLRQCLQVMCWAFVGESIVVHDCLKFIMCIPQCEDIFFLQIRVNQCRSRFGACSCTVWDANFSNRFSLILLNFLSLFFLFFYWLFFVYTDVMSVHKLWDWHNVKNRRNH